MRTRKSIHNVSVMFLTQFITFVLAFVSRTVFIKTLGAEYLGLNGLFFNILNALALAEMGIGTAIAYALYKPIAENDTEQIKSILTFYRKCYFVVGIFITIAGYSILPFLPYLIKDEVTIPVNIYNVYQCFLINSVIGYFFTHKRTIIDETQNKYLTTTIDFTINTIVTIVQIIILWEFQDYMAFLFTRIFGTLVTSIFIFIFANRKFPYIKEQAVNLSHSVKKKIWKDVSVVFFHKLGGLVILGMDFLIISAFVGIELVGIYSNYTLIIGTVTMFCHLFVQGADASIGNAIATLKEKDLYVIFRKIAFLTFCISGVNAICLLNLLNPFIELWIGKNYILSDTVVYVIVANFFLMQNRRLILTFKFNAGLFRSDMYKPFIEIVFNLSISIFLVHIYGILGVLIGTLANTFFINIWVEAFIVYKHIFSTSIVNYLKMYLIQVLALLFAYAISSYINAFIDMFVLKCFVSVFISIGIYFLFFFRTAEFAYFVRIARIILFHYNEDKNNDA
ncbi:MAG: oligosaccharide flippase family protein [Fibromonadaceae bacterium]|jgi:O-antigen/teichoic acid export membrane protein|nr:oligosaccharide flippase family protein [Fibromonadaceae bacterium]